MAGLQIYILLISGVVLTVHCTPVQRVHSVITHIDGHPVFSTAQAHNKPKYLFAPFLKTKYQGEAKAFSFEITFASEEKQ